MFMHNVDLMRAEVAYRQDEVIRRMRRRRSRRAQADIPERRAPVGHQLPTSV
ncbi:hypothetical protein [Phytoactinopolyspora endophytica]|uniref:hypothetical protein n=1 Tax=Phytoactinopolyspora endophytica TaxID=1642495 RepID=UPI0013EC643C|nr:hypothetical protein [Phytoactinopolyspora endophytica]